jgi:hypothetical protein
MSIARLETLLQKKMSRREFLTHIGLGLLAAVGIGGMIKHLLNGNDHAVTKPNIGSYGTSAYGGSKRNNRQKVRLNG